MKLWYWIKCKVGCAFLNVFNSSAMDKCHKQCMSTKYQKFISSLGFTAVYIFQLYSR